MKNEIQKCVRLLLVLALTVATQCTKQQMRIPTCQRVYVLQDHYRLDSVYLRSDSLWPWGRFNNVFCGRDTDQFITEKLQLVRVCGTDELTATRYVIGNKITEPLTFSTTFY